MKRPFAYDSYVTGSSFAGRKRERAALRNLLFSGENVVIYDVPGSGKTSLLRQTLSDATLDGRQFVVADIDFFRCRTTDDFLLEYASGLLSCCGRSASEYSEIVSTFLSGTHFLFDEEQFLSGGRIVTSQWPLDLVDAEAVFSLAPKLASRIGMKIILLLQEFQNIMLTSDAPELLTLMEKEASRRNLDCPIAFTGSRMNAMADIFENGRWFWRWAERFDIGRLNAQEITEMVYMGFRSEGKEVSRDVIMPAAELLGSNLREVNQLFSIVDAMPFAYITKEAVDDGLSVLLSVYRGGFCSIIYSLTAFQIAMLHAVVDGETRLASSSVISKYGLSSPANVKRLRDALCKKEVLWFDHSGRPYFEDPLFEWWLSKLYFAG